MSSFTHGGSVTLTDHRLDTSHSPPFERLEEDPGTENHDNVRDLTDLPTPPYLVRSEAPYRFEAFGYKDHPMLIEIHFKEGHSPINMTFKVRFGGNDVKMKNKKWSYYEDECNKVTTWHGGFSMD